MILMILSALICLSVFGYSWFILHSQILSPAHFKQQHRKCPASHTKKIPGILSVFQLILNMTNLFYPKAIHSFDLHSQSIALIAHYGIGDKLVTAFEPLWNQLDQLMVVWLPLWESWDTFEINLRITW